MFGTSPAGGLVAAYAFGAGLGNRGGGRLTQGRRRRDHPTDLDEPGSVRRCVAFQGTGEVVRVPVSVSLNLGESRLGALYDGSFPLVVIAAGAGAAELVDQEAAAVASTS
jgi:hypothetical protein